jgi:hypothetical protein
VHSPKLKLLHDSFERRQSTRDVFRFIGESLEKANSVALTIKPDNERFEGRCGDPVMDDLDPSAATHIGDYHKATFQHAERGCQ